MDPRDALTPVLRDRWSPTTFDTSHSLSAPEVDVLLEAARWAPSAGNSQPWEFVVAPRGSELNRSLQPHLRGAARRYGAEASLLVANLARVRVEGSDLAYSDFSEYDLGQAVAHLTIQATSMGLHCRQFRSFDLDAVEAVLAPDPGVRLVTMTAIGVAAEEESHRERKEIHRPSGSG